MQNAKYDTSSEPEEPSLGGKLDFKLVITRQLSAIATQTDLDAFTRLVHHLVYLLTPYFDEKTKAALLEAYNAPREVMGSYNKKYLAAADLFKICLGFLDEKGLLLKKAEETIEL